jgi:hypothetical protein
MDLSKMSRATQILLGAGLVLFIDLFLDWQQASLGPVTVGQTGWHGVGVVVGLLVIALLVWEGLQLANVKLNIDLPTALISAGLAAGIVLFTVIKFFVDNELRHWPAWLGLILALAIGYGGWLRYSEGGATTPVARPTEPPAV